MIRISLLALLAAGMAVVPVSGQTRCTTTQFRIVKVVHNPDGSYTRTEEIHRVTVCE